MPIYEYKCTKCGEIFEVFQGIKDPPLKKCKHCSGKVTKLISNCSFQLKGTGWYLTDYARKDSKKTEGAEKKSKPATKTPLENKTPNKKEGKAANKPE